jgi:transposase InsO family protein
MARQTAYYAARVRPAGFYRRLDDETVLQQIRAVTNSRATYGYRRVWAMVNRTFRTGYNRKRIRRLMRMHGLMLPPRVHRRHGHPHLGQVQQPVSNQRWCSDIFLIPCWSGEVLSVAFAIDCHDREGGAGSWTVNEEPSAGGYVGAALGSPMGVSTIVRRRPRRNNVSELGRRRGL